VSGQILFAQAEEHLSSMRIRDAIRFYDLAEWGGYDADACAGGRWMCHMLLGHFEPAWCESDAISNRGNPDAHRFWDERPFDGRRVLIRCLHGLGDTIQFIRYAPLIRGRARCVTIEAQPAMKRLLAESRLADHVIAWGEPEPPWDQQIEVVELPRAFRTTEHSIPTTVPYLHVPSAPTIPPYHGTRPLRAGIVWAASGYNRARSMDLQDMAPLFETPEVEFFSLQAGEERSQLERCPARVENLFDGSMCLLEAAAKLKRLDLLIAVDTMMVHLAGALARPVWTLLPFHCDWRWMIDRPDSPWYPSMRLFRQAKPDAWQAVIEEVALALEQLTARRYSQSLP
jgi:Glycosyltransferase family 9 (heptosyltransferase)